MVDNPFRNYKPEILPTPIERGIDVSRRAFKLVRALVVNTNVQMPTMLPRESELCLSEHKRVEWQPELFEE